ncbi:MAG: hypothetical protein K0R63_114 [Rickettsiales bacterium]|jgi:DNA-binding response OmpR family regulator|nr:hypothetical protein [Rickettsiales bacterium]
MTKVLCIEDEVEFREDVVELLRSEGYQTFEASDGQQGLTMIEEESPEIVLCGLNLPQMSGFDLLRQVIDAHAGKRPSFIFLTAMGQKKDLLTGINLNVDEYMVKPIDYNILLGKIRQHLHRKNNEDSRSRRIAKQVDMLQPEEERAKALTAEIIDTTLELEKMLNLSKREVRIRPLLENIRSLSLRLKDILHNIFLVPHDGEMLFSEEITHLPELLNSIVLYVGGHHASGARVAFDYTQEVAGVLIDHKYFSHAVEKLLLALVQDLSQTSEVQVQASVGKERQIEIKITSPSRPDSNQLRFFTGFATQIMELHGGAFQMKGSRKGAIFVFSIPPYRVIS